MIFKRDITDTLQRYTKFPVIAILGPRQSGKTTLSKDFFKNHKYVTLEDPEILDSARTNPRQFIQAYQNDYGVIFDEFQHVPELLSYIQIEVDLKDRPGYFVLTGSQNFLMNQAITQSLAGRVGILHLLPLSINELTENKVLPPIANQLIYNGGYPRLYTKDFLPSDLFPSYINTYVERDVRQLINIENLLVFRTFMKLCAGRIGQLLNIEDIAVNCGINRKTAEQWLTILEASYILFRLSPYFNNFNKRSTKTPKLYFYDTGLACSLLGIQSAEQIMVSPFRGALFECLIIADLHKQYFNSGRLPSLYFWRDQNGRIEVDCIIDNAGTLIPVEIKSGEKLVPDFFNGVRQWNEMVGTNPQSNYIVYGGTISQQREYGNVIALKDAGRLIEKASLNP